MKTMVRKNSKEFGCACIAAKCNLPLGISSGKFTTDKIITISVYDHGTYPTEAKLNSSGGYRAKLNDPIEYKFVAVKFDNETIVTGVATQGFGDPEIQEWVTHYSIKFTRQKSGEDEAEEYILGSDGRPKVIFFSIAT